MELLEQLTEPPYEPVSLAEAKLWCRITNDDEDTVVGMLIQAMRRDAENRTGRSFIPRQYRLNLNGWPDCYGYRIMLPYPPMISVDLITYLDADGTRQTLDTALYEMYSLEPGYLQPVYQAVWPLVRSWQSSVQVTYTAGYAPGSPTNEAAYQDVLPANLKLWMQTKLATLYEMREQLISGTIVTPLPHGFTDGLLDPLIVGSRIF